MTLRIAVAAVALSALALGCGGDDDDDTSQSTSESVPAGTAPPAGTTPTASATAAPATAPTSPATTPSRTGPVGAASPIPDDPGYLVPEDAGPWALPVDDRTSLRLDGARSWSEPVVDGDAIALIRVAFESNPGYDQYDIAARAPGTATVTVEGDGEEYVITFVVT